MTSKKLSKRLENPASETTSIVSSPAPSNNGHVIAVNNGDLGQETRTTTEAIKAEMTSQFRSMMLTLRIGLLAEICQVHQELVEATLTQLAEKLARLQSQLATKPPAILLPSLRRSAFVLEGQLCQLYEQAGLHSKEASATAREQVWSQLPNLSPSLQPQS